MHKLDRNSIPAPACLAGYHWRRDKWDDVTAGDRAEINAALKSMQGTLCAYCEGPAKDGDAHIEHFRRKDSHHSPQLTFDWSNLFRSCGSRKHCGHFKDRPRGDPYDPNDLIKPDVTDPDSFLYFHTSGEVRVRRGLDDAGVRRASETIRVFGLNDRVLTGRRDVALRQYLSANPGILELLAEFSPDERAELIRDEVSRTSGEPFCTMIRSLLMVDA